MTTDNDPQPRRVFDPHFTPDIIGKIMDAARDATSSLYPEARIPETPMPTFTPLQLGGTAGYTMGPVARWAVITDETEQTVAYARQSAGIVHLLTAAPDLYAALDELFREGGSELLHEDYQPMLERARAALAKARGETP